MDTVCLQTCYAKKKEYFLCSVPAENARSQSNHGGRANTKWMNNLFVKEGIYSK